ncbi:BON domain-containing protein [Cupriavidus sp. 2KB_3]|uniref:BON domain-containing protein n=1 Tax=Cupriavidus TaxID=106589 RepID=UPI0011EF71A4|nr:BON domain-containing protein [Cupriavidus campinensis]
MTELNPAPGSQRATRVRSDASLQDLLCECLWRSGIDVSEVSLTVREGEVTLEGAIGTRADRARIEDTIDHIPGVRAVENRVRVAPDRTGAGR